MAIAYIAPAPASTLNQQHLQWEPWPFQVSLTMVMFTERNVNFCTLKTPISCLYSLQATPPQTYNVYKKPTPKKREWFLS
jgi:hypothetical protein